MFTCDGGAISTYGRYDVSVWFVYDGLGGWLVRQGPKQSGLLAWFGCCGVEPSSFESSHPKLNSPP